MSAAMRLEALSYVDGSIFGRPMAIFPLEPLGKRPLTQQGFKNATADPQQIERWWRGEPEANIGLPLAANGMCAVDLDGPEGENSMWEWMDELGVCSPGTVTAKTGRGRHFYFQLPEGRIGRSSPGVKPGLDLRCRGYLVAPPSVHASGRRYRWQYHPHDRDLALAPEWLLEPLERPAPRVPAPVVVDLEGATGTRYGVAALGGLLDDMERAQEGTRHATLIRVAIRIAELVEMGHLNPEDVFWRLETIASGTGLGEREITTTIRDARNRAAGAAR